MTRSTKLCADCKWCLPGASRWLRRTTYADARCTNPEVSPALRVASHDMVDADLLRWCLTERGGSREFSPCGPDAKLWDDLSTAWRESEGHSRTKERAEFHRLLWVTGLGSGEDVEYLLTPEIYKALQETAENQDVMFKCHVMCDHGFECVVVKPPGWDKRRAEQQKQTGD